MTFGFFFQSESGYLYEISLKILIFHCSPDMDRNELVQTLQVKESKAIATTW